jgi:hypothetical protein
MITQRQARQQSEWKAIPPEGKIVSFFKALQPTVNPLRGLSAAELGRSAAIR